MVAADPSDDREIERKYLLRALPDRVRDADSLEIDQGYLPGVRINERIRRARGPGGVKYYRTMKFGAGMDRLELEDETTEEFFDATWPLTRGARVWKRRYLVPEGELVWEIDEFLDRSGLWLAEIELDHVDQVVPIPDWLAPSVVREVTFEKGYTNRALAR
jgi:CYTH domain-containing protein